MTEVYDWNNPTVQFCVKNLQNVPNFNHNHVIAHADQEVGKQDYVYRLARVIFSSPDKSGGVEMMDKAIKNLKGLTKSELANFVGYMQMYANARLGR